jgi:hypothetical protein
MIYIGYLFIRSFTKMQARGSTLVLFMASSVLSIADRLFFYPLVAQLAPRRGHRLILRRSRNGDVDCPVGRFVGVYQPLCCFALFVVSIPSPGTSTLCLEIQPFRRVRMNSLVYLFAAYLVFLAALFIFIMRLAIKLNPPGKNNPLSARPGSFRN